MFKMIITAKRKQGMTMEAFRDYYETRHSVFVQTLSSEMRRYVRNYMGPFMGGEEPPFDCITEVWVDSEEALRKSMEKMASDTQKIAALTADEENLFDRATIRFFSAVECESALK